MMQPVLPKMYRIAVAALMAADLFPLPAQLAAPALEVASIRPHTAALRTIMGHTISGLRITMEGYTISQLIMEAYRLKGMWQISLPAVRGQDDLLSVYYDIVARAPEDGTLTRDASRKMLQTLLADRFRLSIHREMKETPVYALVRGKNGPKLKDGTGDSECSVHIGVETGGQSYSFSNCTIDSLADMPGDGMVDRPVVNETQLTGKYDFRFLAMPALMNRNQSDPTDLSPFTAIRDLGLNLQARTAPMEIIAVDRVDKPTEN